MNLILFYRIKNIIKLGSKSLWMHRLRSFLTVLGIIFGVASVIAMLAIGEGASQQAQQQIKKLGSTNIIIKTVKPPETQSSDSQSTVMQQYGLTFDDAERFRNVIPNVEVIVPVRKISQQAWYRNKKASIEIIGTVPWYPEMAPIDILMGRFLSPTDQNYQQAVCVLDENVVDAIFVFDDPIGQNVKIGRDYYSVVGIVGAKTDTQPGEDDDLARQSAAAGVSGRIYIPLSTAKARFGDTEVQIGGQGAKAEKVELQEITVKVNDISQVLPTRELLANMLEHFHKKNDYQIIVPLELLRQAARTKRIFSIVLGSIAAISLLVGGIGIMNIMLATVSERTREIGIRRALGAKKRDIVIQFLAETIMLTIIGGIFGIVFGILIPIIVTYLGKMPTVITAFSLILAFGISAAVGLAFGIYPAYRAANMDPIESLRHE